MKQQSPLTAVSPGKKSAIHYPDLSKEETIAALWAGGIIMKKNSFFHYRSRKKKVLPFEKQESKGSLLPMKGISFVSSRNKSSLIPEILCFTFTEEKRAKKTGKNEIQMTNMVQHLRKKRNQVMNVKQSEEYQSVGETLILMLL